MKRIRIKRKRLQDAWGLAFPDKREIHLDDRLDDKTLMDIALHEGTHVLQPYLAEEAVDEIGKSLADLLWKLGFRLGD